MPGITLFFLQASRAIRTAWLLEELEQDYDVEFADRVNQKAPQEFKEASGNPLGKFPSIRDGDLNVYESGAITEYLCEKYDGSHQLLPTTQPARSQALIWIHAAEATFMLHGLAITYARWNLPKEVAEKDGGAVLKAMEEGLSVNVRKDFDWLEAELSRKPGKFLLGGDTPTAADIMMEFSIEFLTERGLGTSGGSWPHVDAWLKHCMNTDGYKRAIKKTGYTLYPKTI